MTNLFSKISAVARRPVSNRLPHHVDGVTTSTEGKHRKSPLYGYLSRILTIIGVSGLILFGVSLFEQPSITPQTSFSIPASAMQQQTDNVTDTLPESKPLHIKVPSVGIDADIQEVGKLEDGTMETPPLDIPVTGWYKLGPSPGELGPAIIVGHVDTYKGPSVFFRLKDLKAEDIIEINREDGKVVKFKVTGLEQFEQNNFPTEKVYGNIDHAGIRLITCGGSFDQKTQKYSHNTVVFGVMVDS